MKNATLVVYDANGFPIDTLHTDEFGQFNYNKIAYEEGFSIAPIDMSDEDWSGVEMYLTDANGKEFRLINRNNRLFFEAADEDPRQAELPEQMEEKPRKTGKGASFSGSAGWNGMSTEEKYIHFDFTVTGLNAAEKKKLDLLVALLQEEDGVQLQIVGHTDNLGDEEINQKVGLKRAEAVKNYLSSKKIVAHRITTSSKGESMPIDTNDTEEGQARNRRVEIILK